MDNGNYGHRRMVIWKNLDEIEDIMQTKILRGLPKNQFNLIDQIDRARSSSVANFIEGYYSGSLKEYIRFLKYSKRSLAELQDWIRRAFCKNFMKSLKPFFALYHFAGHYGPLFLKSLRLFR